jgi:hypothetical protein
MNRYTIQLTKTIVVKVESESQRQACKLAAAPDNEHDGAWDRAEAVVLGVLLVEPVSNVQSWDNTQAIAEGWSLFEVEGRYQLQKDDEAGKFDTDAAAIVFVSLQAAAGSQYHWDALHRIGEAVK